MNHSKRNLRKLTIKCQGCDQEILRGEYDNHILGIVRSLRA